MEKGIEEGKAELKDVNMDTDSEEENKEQAINISSDDVKDRWSRYIGALGIEAVAK